MPRKRDQLLWQNIKAITDPKRRRQVRFGFKKGFQVKDNYGTWNKVVFKRAGRMK